MSVLTEELNGGSKGPNGAGIVALAMALEVGGILLPIGSGRVCCRQSVEGEVVAAYLTHWAGGVSMQVEQCSLTLVLNGMGRRS
jgi:hypothetical protein